MIVYCAILSALGGYSIGRQLGSGVGIATFSCLFILSIIGDRIVETIRDK